MWGSASRVGARGQAAAPGGQSPWHWSNDVLNAWLMSVVLCGALIAVFGVGIMPYLIISGGGRLHAARDRQLPGALRDAAAEAESGRYERCARVHSWNSNNIATNLFLYHLQRHSDHHANPTRRYQTLRSMEGAPTCPPATRMIVLAFFPPLWREVMDHRVVAHYDGDITRANIQPRMRAKMLAKYGASL